MAPVKKPSTVSSKAESESTLCASRSSKSNTSIGSRASEISMASSQSSESSLSPAPAMSPRVRTSVFDFGLQTFVGMIRSLFWRRPQKEKGLKMPQGVTKPQSNTTKRTSRSPKPSQPRIRRPPNVEEILETVRQNMLRTNRGSSSASNETVSSRSKPAERKPKSKK